MAASNSLEKSFAVHMRQIDDHAQAIRFFDHFDAEIRQPAAGAVFPYAVAELVAKIPNRLQRAQTQTVKISKIVDAAAQRHAAFEVKQKLDAARLDFIGQIAARLDHLDHAFRARRLFEKLIDLIERRFQITAGVLRMGIGVAARSRRRSC